MAKKVVNQIKLQIPAGQATPAPPVGPALGQAGVNIMDFEVGEEVRLTEGRYASMRGIVEEVNEARGKLRVVINMFGRPVPTELSFHQVEKLS